MEDHLRSLAVRAREAFSARRRLLLAGFSLLASFSFSYWHRIVSYGLQARRGLPAMGA